MKRGEAAGILDPFRAEVPQHPQVFQPFEIRGEPHAEPPARILRDLPDQQTGGEHATVAGGDHPVAGPNKIRILEELDRRHA
jgi:hypothetical protein